MSAQLIYQHIKQKLGEPQSEESLSDYVTHCLSIYETDSVYAEKHHILPRSKFPELSEEEWNIALLPYEKHVEAHVLLAEAYPIRKFLRPLNFMLNESQKKDMDWYETHRKSLSEASKKMWKEMSEEKKRDHSKRISESMLGGQAKHMAERYYSQEGAIEKRRRDSVQMWKEMSEEKKRDHSRKTSEGRAHIDQSKLSTEVWASRSEEERASFKKKMASINKDETKRKAAGRKIKDKWQCEEYRAKMKNRGGGRKKRPVTIEGITYSSISEAVEKTKLKLHQVRKHL